MTFPVTQHTAATARHRTAYLAAGPEDGPLLIFVHGWPELSLSWRHQLACFAMLGWRAIAPDMRGYGGSGLYGRHEDYALRHTVADMLELLASTGRERAVWIGHDWGSPVVWSLASHHPERCRGVANLCVPHIPAGFTPEALLSLIDRRIYPEAEYPVGQWDYQYFYRESFAKAQATFEADVAATFRALFRKGNPAGRGKPSRTALVRRNDGWFGPLAKAPPLPLDTDVLGEAELARYVAAFEATGFFGACSWYMNAEANRTYAAEASQGGRLDMPVLFLHGLYDYTCETVDSSLAQPMRESCPDLTEVVVRSGHWMAQEQPAAVNVALAGWLATRFNSTPAGAAAC